MQNLKQKILFIGTTTILSILMMTIPLLSSHRFIIFSLLPVFYFGYSLFDRDKFLLPIIPSDIGWLVFMIVGFASYFWAVNGALVWYPAFGCLCLILWMLIFRILAFQKIAATYLPILFLSLFLLFAFYILILCFYNKLNDEIEWNHYFGYNVNITVTYFVCLYSFLLFFNSDKVVIKILRILSAVLILYVLFISSARGALMAFLVSILYYFWTIYPRKYFLNFIGLAVFTLFCLYVFNFIEYISNVSHLPMLKELGLFGDLNRVFGIRSSIEIFLNDPILGIGLGNWHLESHAEDIIKRIGLDSIQFIHFGNHNFYSQLLAELGLIGFLSFYTPFYILIWKGWSQCKRLNSLQKACYVAIICYLLSSFFYRDANIYETNFSILQFVAFCALGLLSSDSETRFYQLNSWGKGFFFFAAISCFIWFLYYMQTSLIYAEATKMIKDKETSRAISLIERVYHPIFKTTHEFYEEFNGYNQPIALKLAELYEQQKDYYSAEKYYLEALELAPNDENVIIPYARFLLRIKKEHLNAKEHLLSIYSKISRYSKGRVLLIEILIEEECFNEVRYHLDKMYSGHYNAKVKLLNELLYSSDYLNELIQLTDNQRRLLKELSKNSNTELTYFIHDLYRAEVESKSQEIYEMRFKLKESNKKREDSLLEILDNEQFLLYLKDASKNILEYKFRILDFVLKLTDVQKREIKDLFININVKQNNLDKRLHLLETQNNREKKLFYEEELNKLALTLDRNFKQTLSAEQYSILEKLHQNFYHSLLKNDLTDGQIMEYEHIFITD